MINLIILIILLILLLNTIKNVELYSLSNKKKNNNYPFVSVLIPVRNEEDSIEACLESLINQDYPNYEIIVLNDNSTDKSPEIIKNICKNNPKIKYIDGKKLEEGWIGKNFACYQLAKEAKGEWFLFTDADTIHKNNSISVMINEALNRNVDFLTLLPFKTTGSILGHIFLSIVNFFFVVLFPGILLNFQNKYLAFALGPFILIKKDIYWKIDGHKSVKDKVVEDVYISRRVKENGGKIAIVNGTNYLDVFYYNNFKETWYGFTKNFFGALENSLFLAILLVSIVFITFLYPTYNFFYNMLILHNYEIINVLQLIVIFLIWSILVKYYKEPISIIVLYPICFFITYLILFNSIYMSFNKKLVEWKKRTYEV